MTEAVGQLLEIVLGESKFTGRGIDVWVAETADGLPKRISPHRSQPLTFRIPVSASSFIIADHAIEAVPDHTTGRIFPIARESNALMVGTSRIHRGQTFTEPIAIAGRSLSLSILQQP